MSFESLCLLSFPVYNAKIIKQPRKPSCNDDQVHNDHDDLLQESPLFSQCFGEIPDFVTYEMNVLDDDALLGVADAFRGMKAFS